MRLLDTDVLVDIRRGFAPAEQWYMSLVERPGVPGFVAMELVAGCRDKRELQRLQTFLFGLPIIWPSEADCQRGLEHLRDYKLSHSLGLIDALIAATAIGQGATLCTFNVKHFSAVPGLVTEQPYSRT
jgi:predicted nucleic acid-binding protein